MEDRAPALTAHAAGLETASVGKSGPAYIQDYREDGARGVILDENIAFPLSFAKELQAAGYALPRATTRCPYTDGAVSLGSVSSSTHSTHKRRGRAAN